MFRKMLAEVIQITEVTTMAIVHACSELGNADKGNSVYELLLRNALCSDSSVMNCLITMYYKCEGLDIATKIF